MYKFWNYTGFYVGERFIHMPEAEEKYIGILEEDKERAVEMVGDTKHINAQEMTSTEKIQVPLAGAADGWIPQMYRIGTIVWIVGMFLFFSWNVYLAVCMKRKLRKAVRYKGNIYECEDIPAPFVMGLLFPRIYIPFRLGESEKIYILQHEQYHIQRKDYLVKLAAMLLTIVYWFHPLVWIAYFCMGMDMEMSCDEHVLASIGEDIRVNYSECLLAFAMNKRQLPMGLLAFGETGIRKRVKNIMKFQKQRKWSGIAASLLMIVVGSVCLTNAVSHRKQEIDAEQKESGKQEIVIATERVHDYDLQLVYLSEDSEPEITDMGVYEGKYVLKTRKDMLVYDEHILEFPEQDTLAFPEKGIQFVLKDYDGDQEKDDFSLGQGQQPLPYLGNWMQYEFFTVDEDGSIVQFCLSTENGDSILTIPGEYSGDFEQKGGEVYYSGLMEMMTTSIMRPEAVVDNVKNTAKVYRNYVETLKEPEKIYGDGIYTATMQSGKGEEILLVTDHIMEDGTSTHADIYQCVGGKILFIGEIHSTGSGYPLCKDGPYVLAGYHHSSAKLKVDYGVGTLYELDGIGTGKETCTVNKYIVKNNKNNRIFTKTITEQEAQEADYYYDAKKGDVRGEEIVFSDK